MDWFDDIIQKGAEAYTARESRKLEEAKVEQAQLLNAVPRDQQPNTTPTDAKATTAAVIPAAVSSNMPTLSKNQWLGLGAAGALLVGLFVIRGR